MNFGRNQNNNFFNIIRTEAKSIDLLINNFRYFGTGVNLGECGITIIVADMIDTGIWSCHMGTTGAATVEASKEINVRISGRGSNGLCM